MIKVENISVMNFEGAIRGMRNPLESWNQSDSFWGFNEFHLGDKDIELALKLIKAGSDHSKFMRQIFVSMDITAPDYWYKEFDTYKVGTVANSTSTMHKLTTRLLTYNDFSFDEIPREVDDLINYLNQLIMLYQAHKENGEDEETIKRVWRNIIQTLPMSFLYTRTVTLNYQNLRNMYHNRKFHKLSEWKEFCKLVETLPYSEFITAK